MPLNDEQKDILVNAGFVPFEITEFDDARTPSGGFQNMNAVFESQPFQDMLVSRAEWVEQRLAEGWTEEEIEQAVMELYDDLGYESPWEFLREEYGRGKK